MSGNRMQVIRAFPADHALPRTVPSIRQWAVAMDAVFQLSATQTGRTGRVRFVTDSTATVVIRVGVSPGDDNLDATVAEPTSVGDRASADIFNSGSPAVPGSVAGIDAGCRGLASRGESAEAQERMHSPGAVMPTAPNVTTNGHYYRLVRLRSQRRVTSSDS